MNNNSQLIPAWHGDTLTPMDKLTVHLEGIRHKAVSVFLLAGDALLIQQRAMGKYHTPGLWANTCCTHPIWGETDADCAVRRLQDELGITGVALEPRGQLHYRADVGGDMIEDEEVAVFVGQVTQGLSVTPNPEEVMAHRWTTLDRVQAEIAATPDAFTPWLKIYLSEHRDQILGA